MTGPARPSKPPMRAATVAWLGLILSVTLARSMPSLPHRATTLTEALGVGACLVLLSSRYPGSSDRAERRLMGWMLLVPISVAVLAIARGQYANAASPVISGLALLAFGRIDARTRAESAWRALMLLVGASVVLGVVDRSFVEPNERSFLRMLYDGRLFGLLQTPNVLGECAVLLAILSFAVKTGRERRFGIGLALFSILAASSQTAAAAVGAALILWWAWRKAGNGGITLLAWAGITAVVGVVMWATMRPNHPLESISQLWAGLTFSNRLNVWQLLLSYHVPFTGLGQDAVTEIFATHVIPGATGVSSAHNVGLDAYMRDGWVGVAALAAALIAIVRFISGRRNLLAMAALAAFVLESCLEVTPSHPPFYALFFTAVAAAAGRVAERGPEAVTAPAGATSGSRPFRPTAVR